MSQKFYNRTITQMDVCLLQLYKNGENKFNFTSLKRVRQREPGLVWQ